MSDQQTTASDAEMQVRRWRAREAAAFALIPIMDREGLHSCSAGELAQAAIGAFEQVVAEPLPEGWREYVGKI